MVTHQTAMDVRPKFFHLITDCIPCHLCYPNIDIAAECPGAGMVGIGDCCGNDITENFRVVALSFSSIRARNQDSGPCIPGAVEKASRSHLVEAWILFLKGDSPSRQ